MSRLVLTCKTHHCTIEPLISTHQTQPIQCPKCSRTIKVRGWDEYDDLTEKYPISRITVYNIDVFLREHLNKFEGSLESHLISRFHIKVMSNGYTPISCICSSCHSSFRYFAELPTVQSPPQFCPYCGNKSISIKQDSDLDCWEVLANAYHVSVPMIRLMYSLFQQQNARTHFADFVTLIKEQLTNV